MVNVIIESREFPRRNQHQIRLAESVFQITDILLTHADSDVVILRDSDYLRLDPALKVSRNL